MSVRGAFEDGPGPALAYFGFRAAAVLAERVPLRAGDLVARAGGELWYRLTPGRRRTVRRNLARVVGEGPHLEEVVHDAFLSYARYWLETFRAGRYGREELLAMVDSPNLEFFESVLSRGEGVIVVTAHFGFYDLGVSWVGVKGYPVTTVAEVLRPRALFEWFAAVRERRGFRVVPSSPGRQAWRALLGALRRAEAVAIVADRDIARGGVWVELFGEPTTVPKGPALLALRTGAPLLSGAIYSTGRRYVMEFDEIPYVATGDEARDLPAVAQAIARAVERVVRKAPEQWHLFSTNWPSDEPHLPARGSRTGEGASPPGAP